VSKFNWPGQAADENFGSELRTRSPLTLLEVGGFEGAKRRCFPCNVVANIAGPRQGPEAPNSSRPSADCSITSHARVGPEIQAVRPPPTAKWGSELQRTNAGRVQPGLGRSGRVLCIITTLRRLCGIFDLRSNCFTIQIPVERRRAIADAFEIFARPFGIHPPYLQNSKPKQRIAVSFGIAADRIGLIFGRVSPFPNGPEMEGRISALTINRVRIEIRTEGSKFARKVSCGLDGCK
jgi:hypothetical protein